MFTLFWAFFRGVLIWQQFPSSRSFYKQHKQTEEKQQDCRSSRHAVQSMSLGLPDFVKRQTLRSGSRHTGARVASGLSHVGAWWGRGGRGRIKGERAPGWEGAPSSLGEQEGLQLALGRPPLAERLSGLPEPHLRPGGGGVSLLLLVQLREDTCPLRPRHARGGVAWPGPGRRGAEACPVPGPGTVTRGTWR